MISLKRSHLGYLNRLYKEAELLMRNPENFREIRSKKKDIEDAFGRFIQSNEEYYQLVAEPETKAGGGHWSLLETAKP